MAYFMRNDSPDFFQRGLNTLEKVTRQYHMHEIYAAAAPIYSNMKENLPWGTELCACVNDIRGNGILVEMANIARQLKYFQSKRTPRQTRPYAYAIEVPKPRGLHPVASLEFSTDIITKREADDTDVSALKVTNLANPTVADRPLDAHPWIGNTLVYMHFLSISITS